MDNKRYEEKNGNLPVAVEDMQKVKTKDIEKEKLIKKFNERNKLETKGNTCQQPCSALNFRTAALVVAFVSICITLALGIATFVIAVMEDSAASYGFAINAILDCCSSAVVIWRFYSKDKLMSLKKEFQACVTLGILFLLSFVSTFTKSLHDLLLRERPSLNPLLWMIAIVNAIMCFILAMMKFYLAYKTGSKPMASDGLNSFVGFILATGIVIEGRIYDDNRRAWWLDGSFGVLCSLILLGYAISLLVTACNQKKIMSHSFENIEMEDPRPSHKQMEEE